MDGLLKSTDLTAILIATITVFLTNYFTYLFTLRKDAKQSNTKYRISILEELYTPIYKIIIRGVNPLEGYEGLTQRQFDEIEEIVSNKYMLVDPILDNIMWCLKEMDFSLWHFEGNHCYYYDEDRKLLNHVEKQYNKLRRSIGLPYQNKNIFFRYINKRKQLILLRYRIWKSKNRRNKSNI